MKIIDHIKKSVLLTRTFGISFGILYLLEKSKIVLISQYCMKLRMMNTKKWIQKRYSGVLKTENKRQRINQRRVWVYWGQGIENAPDLVQTCINSIRKNIGEEITLITNTNYQEYVDIDDIILEKFRAGTITYTHFSDILRCELLYKYGGLWLDSTVLLTDFDNDIWNRQYWTVRRKEDRTIGSISFYRWNNAVIRGDASIFYYMSLLFKAYWADNNELIDYFLVDYFMDLIYDSLPACRKLIDDVPYNNAREFDLMNMINEEYMRETYINLTSECYVHKLQRRGKLYTETADGKLTYYGHLKIEYTN